MASFLRPGLLRQACQAPTASQRMLSTFTSSSAARTAPLAQQFRPQFVRKAIPQKSSRIAAFHATRRQAILPPLPQVLKGSVNDPAPVPPPSPAHGGYHWTFERLVSVGLVPLCLAPFAAGSLNPIMDATLCALLVIHGHIGFESCIIDYLPTYRIPTIHKIAMWLLRAATVTLGIALYSFETNDVGITEAVKRIWHA